MEGNLANPLAVWMAYIPNLILLQVNTMKEKPGLFRKGELSAPYGQWRNEGRGRSLCPLQIGFPFPTITTLPKGRA